MNIIEVKNLSKKFDNLIAVNNINFTVKKGEIFGFLGPNGAGKTTTINMITGLSRMSHGTIKVSELDVARDIKKIQRFIGIVPDESNLYMDFDGYENLCFCASLYGMKKDEKEPRARELLKQFGLENTLGRTFKTFSRGMKRKLTIAAGIIHKPRILFLDEPTTGIDIESARRIRDLIAKLHEEGTTIFLTTHYIEEAERLCDRIAFIVDGKIVKTGNIEELVQSVQKENIIQLTLDKKLLNISEDLKKNFEDSNFEIKSNNILIFHSLNDISLMPLIKFFDERGFKVYEAKIIKPTLEEVFLKITGIRISKDDMKGMSEKK